MVETSSFITSTALKCLRKVCFVTSCAIKILSMLLLNNILSIDFNKTLNSYCLITVIKACKLIDFCNAIVTTPQVTADSPNYLMNINTPINKRI